MGPQTRNGGWVGACLFARFMVYLSSTQIINVATGWNEHTVRHGLQSEKSGIWAVHMNHPKTDNPVTFIDMPGLHDTYMSDIGILTMIAEWLVKMWYSTSNNSYRHWFLCSYKGRVNLATIIYMHRIINNGITSSLLGNLQMFVSLCGQETMSDVVLVIVHWHKLVNLAKGEQWGRADAWLVEGLLNHGCKSWALPGYIWFHLRHHPQWELTWGKNSQIEGYSSSWGVLRKMVKHIFSPTKNHASHIASSNPQDQFTKTKMAQ